MPWIMSMDSTSISMRSRSVILNISKSGGVAPGPIPMRKRPSDDVVELGGLAGDDGRVLVGEAEHAGAELDALGLGHQGGEEHERRLDRLRGQREMLAEPDLVETDRVGALDDLKIFLEQRVIAAPKILDRVHEHAELHDVPPWRRSLSRRLLW